MLKKIQRVIMEIRASLVFQSHALEHVEALRDSVYEQTRANELRNNPRYTDPKCLIPFGYRVYSQNDEDGIIAEIFSRIGTTNRSFVEFGIGDGRENNSMYLLAQGWNGAWIEADPATAQLVQSKLAPLTQNGQLRFKQAFITAEGIEALFDELRVPTEPDLLVIDIDGNDLWVWKAITRFQPRVVVVEYNAPFGPTLDWTVPYRADRVWDGSRNHGASLKALENLGREKGYSLVGCNLNGVNAFFVRDDLVGDRFLTPHTSERHWERARPWFKYSFLFPVSHDEVQGFTTVRSKKS